MIRERQKHDSDDFGSRRQIASPLCEHLVMRDIVPTLVAHDPDLAIELPRDQPGFAPTVMFSVLAPRTTIPAHTGSTNIRQIVH